MAFIIDLSFGMVIAVFTSTVFVWVVSVATYRLFLGPLSQFPGPKLAALTGWYETYFDCWKRGRYWVEIERMHKQYGTTFPVHCD